MVSHHLAKFGGHRHCGSGDLVVLVCLAKRCDERVKLLYGQKSIKVSYHYAKFGDYGNSGSGDMLLICHVIMAC